MKKIILVGIMFMMFMGIVSASSKNGEYKGDSIIKVLSNGIELQSTDVPAVLHDGRTLVPLYMLKQIGIELTWDLEKYSVEVKLPKSTTTPAQTPQPQQKDVILDLKNYTSAIMGSLKNIGIILDTYSLNVDKNGLYAYAQYQPDVSSAFAYSKAIASIASMVTILNYPIDGTIIGLKVGSTTTGTVWIETSDAKDYVNKKITLSEFEQKWKNTINDLSKNTSKQTPTPAPSTAPSSTSIQNAAMCRIINSKYDDQIRQVQEDLNSRGILNSSILTDSLNTIEADRKNELELYGCPTK
jgi:hypothetical protein